MGKLLTSTALSLTTIATYAEVGSIRVLDNCSEILIQFYETDGEDVTYKICGRNTEDGSDDGYDFDIPNSADNTEFSLTGDGMDYAVILEGWVWLVIKAKDAVAGTHGTINFVATAK